MTTTISSPNRPKMTARRMDGSIELPVAQHPGDQGGPLRQAADEDVLVFAMQPIAQRAEAVQRGDALEGGDLAVRPAAAGSLADSHAVLRTNRPRLLESRDHLLVALHRAAC